MKFTLNIRCWIITTVSVWITNISSIIFQRVEKIEQLIQIKQLQTTNLKENVSDDEKEKEDF
jgi:hypothetical protein